jgi:hypothetical protein
MWPFSKPKIGGFIGQAGLADWWLAEFDDAERAHILATFQPTGAGDGAVMLVQGQSGGRDHDPSKLLSSLAGWFKRETDRTVGYRIIDKAEELLATSPSILTKHFTYQAKAEIYYRWREIDSFALDRAEKACRDQIALAPRAAEAFLPSEKKPLIEIDWFNDNEDEARRKIDLVKRGEATFDRYPLNSLPSHHGYKQLSIIMEKRGDHKDARVLCEQAKAEGWKGDWESRIARLQKKLAKGSG